MAAANVEVHAGGVIAISGDLDIAAFSDLVAAVEGVAVGTPIVLDVRDVGFVDSSGLKALLLARAASVKSSGRTVRVIGANEGLRKIVAITGTEDLFDFEPDQDDAPRHWSAPQNE